MIQIKETFHVPEKDPKVFEVVVINILIMILTHFQKNIKKDKGK